MKEKTKQVAIREKSYEVGKIKDMTAMSAVLKSHVIKQNLYTNIKGKNYVHIEGWQFAGGMMGLIPKVAKVENLSNDKEVKWKADVELVNAKTGQAVSYGFAICSSKETTKKGFDEYAILSMAQTRAVGKAYRNLIGWVMKLAGYEGTPSEEMRKVDEVPKDPQTSNVGQPSKPQEVKKGQVLGPDGKPTWVCSCHGDPISDSEYAYSVKMFGKPLCREGQADVKKKK